MGRELAVQRFRPNLLVESSEREDAWVGRVLRVGGMAMRVDQRDERCVVVNVDPVSGERDPSVLKTLARERSTCIGVYGSVVTLGRVSCRRHRDARRLSPQFAQICLRRRGELRAVATTHR